MRSPEEQRHNLAQAILHVRSGRATSRRTLADLMKLSPTTAGLYVDQLIESGHLCESGLEQGLMGRPKRSLSTVAEAGWFVGIEFNAERVQGVLVDFSGKLHRAEMSPLPEGSDAAQVMAEITRVITTLVRGTSAPLMSIGLGAPGVVDPQSGIGVYYAFLTDWKDVPVAKQLQKRFKVPVTLENNLRAIALAERWFGGAKQLSDYLILGPRSGFGVAMVVGGALIGGAHHAAGEVGLWPWPSPDGITQMHHHLSAPAAWRRLKGVDARHRLPTDLRRALSLVNDANSAAYQSLTQDYAQVLASLHLLLDTTTAFLHGPLTALGAPFCSAISSAIAALSPALADRPITLQPSTLKDDAGALGAASLAMERWMPA